MCKVLNKHASGSHADAVYIGRGSKWGNPFLIGIDGDRAKPSSPSTNAGCAISTICCARSMNCAATTCCASARPKPVMAICCCGSPTLRARSA